MALERKDLVQDTATSTGTSAFVMAGTPAAGFQAFSVHTNGATFDYKAAAGAQWEVGVGTWNGSNIARSPTASSSANALVNFTTAPTVMEVVSAASVATFLRAADGVDVSTLSAVGSLNTGDSVLLLRNGTLYTALASLFGSANTTTPVQVITVNNPGPQTVGVTYTASGTYTNGTPTALDFSVDGGTNWTAVASPTISGGNFSFSSTPSTASASRQMMVRDHTTLVYGTSTAYVVSAAPATDTTAPTAVSAAVANAAPTTVTITMSEAMSATFVPAASAFTVSGHSVANAAISGSSIILTVDAFVNGEAARTVTYVQPGANYARDLAGNALLGFSGLAITNNVAAAGGTVYQFNGKKFGPDVPTSLSFGGNDFIAANFDFIIKTAAGAGPDETTTDVYAAMSTSSSVMPRPNDAAHASAPANGLAFKSCGRIGTGNAAYDGCYAMSSLYTYKSFGGGLSTRYMWIMVFAKGADPASATPIWSGVYDGIHTGTPVAIVMSA